MQAANTLSGLQGNLYLMLLVSLLSLSIGVICGVYMEEWLPRTNWIRRVIEAKVAIFAGIPSLLYGLLGVEAFVLGADRFRFYLRALTFVLLVMPITIQATQRAIRHAAPPLREAAYALGSTKWQVLIEHVFPLALPELLAGMCRAISRALALAGMLIVIHAATATGGVSIFQNITGQSSVLLGGALCFSVIASRLERHSRRHL